MRTQTKVTGGYQMFKQLIATLSILITALTLSACGGAGSDYNQEAQIDEGDGKLMLSLTDAEGDFLTYAVDITSIQLTRLDGSKVEVVPQETRIDFAQYVEMTEFFTAATLPSGRYSSVIMTLDYQNADISVEDKDGNPVDATIVDNSGNVTTTIEVAIDLGENGLLKIFPGLPSFLTIDFDLESSHTLDMTTTPVTASLNPLLIADTMLEDPKPHLVRGQLKGVDEENAYIAVDLRPFRFHQGRFGTAYASVSDDTHYEIDGESYFGSEGLAVLALLEAKTPILITGDVQVSQRKFVASHVVAGTSLPWGSRDIISGNVIARDGDIVTVRGVTLVRASGTVTFRDTVDIIIAETTKVTQVGVGETTTNHISIGQRISLYGDLSVDSESYTVLDATTGGARLHVTTMCGTVTALNPLTLDLQAINGRPATIYDFTGTGSDNSQDADPNAYEIDTQDLSLDGIAIGDPVRVRGFVEGYGSAPEDFNATTVINVSSVVSRLMIRWPSPGAEASITLQDDLLAIDTQSEELGNIHHIRRAGIITDVSTVSETASIAPRAEKTGLFVLRTPIKVFVFYRYDVFEKALEAALEAERSIIQIRAAGRYDDNNNSIKAGIISVVVI